jgi:hypothetical protein
MSGASDGVGSGAGQGFFGTLRDPLDFLRLDLCLELSHLDLFDCGYEWTDQNKG